MPTSASGDGELFYDENGKRADDVLHQWILDDGDAEAATAVGRAQLKRIGLSSEQIDALIGEESKKNKLWRRRTRRGLRARSAKANAEAALARSKWDESQHPREPAGSPDGGQFTSSGGGSGGGEAAAADAAKLDPAVTNVGGDAWNQATAQRLEREYQDARPKLDKLANEAPG